MAIDHPQDALPPGYRLGNYEILRVLGRGGFGLTYQARRAGVAGDMVAIKELYPHGLACRAPNMAVVPLPGTPEAQISCTTDMFLREAKLICDVDHPNIVRGVEAFHENGTGYLVMRYVSGRNLRESLRDPAGFRPNARSLPALLSPLLDALDTLHRHDLLHCDIKPDNIFLGVGLEPILIDLGSARWRVAGAGVEDAATYSQYFSAIEQVTDRFGTIGPWTDIYQLSAVVYRCMAGGKLPDAVDRAAAAEDPFSPLAEIPEVTAAYPRPLIDAIDRGLRIFPKDRPQSVAEWRQPMEPVLPRPAHVTQPLPRAASRQVPQAQAGGHTQPSPLPQTDQMPSEPTPSTGSSPDFLLWVAGGLLVLIVLTAVVYVAGEMGW